MDANTAVKGATIMNQKNWVETSDINFLRTVPAEPQGKRHHPINHGDALEIFRTVLHDRNLPVINSHGMMSRME